MILVTHRPLEGVLVVFARLFQWTGIHKVMFSSDLHKGLKPMDGCRDPMLGARK
jgi:hypothetical protein